MQLAAAHFGECRVLPASICTFALLQPPRLNVWYVLVESVKLVLYNSLYSL